MQPSLIAENPEISRLAKQHLTASQEHQTPWVTALADMVSSGRTNHGKKQSSFTTLQHLTTSRTNHTVGNAGHSASSHLGTFPWSFLKCLTTHTQPPTHLHNHTHRAGALSTLQSCFKKSMQNKCVIKFIGVSIQTLPRGKDDDMQIPPQGATENRVGGTVRMCTTPNKG